MEREKRKKSWWRRLDNTAKIFPVIANENMSQVFRTSVTLKEEIRPELLKQALEEILPEIDQLRVKLKRGFFWYYFEENPEIPQVSQENTYPCRYIDPHGNRKFLFRVTYYGKRINLEMFHGLTDGLGSILFLKRLTAHYLRLAHGDPDSGVKEDEKPPQEQALKAVDSYLENYREIPHHSYSSRPAYRIRGTFMHLGNMQVLHGYLPLAKTKAACSCYGVTVTRYLAAALIWSIWQEYLNGKSCREPVVLNVPINLRSFFGSDTVSNFFAVTMIGYLFRNPEMTFDKLVGILSRQMDRKIDKDRLAESISYNVSNEKKWYLRMIPLFLKAPVLAFLFRLKDRAYSMTLSNLGLIQMDEEYADEIERFHIFIGVSRRQPIKCTVCTYGDEIVVTFASVLRDSRLQKRFFQKLKSDGIPVTLEGNELCGARKKDMYPRVRLIRIMRPGGEEKAARMAKKTGETLTAAIGRLSDYLSGRASFRAELQRRLHI
ncbi:MAG: hypothetical protein LUE86_12080 [Clostridiales bacterium]|nr:hypothetical protein [Clostridiales bacterium]